VEVFYEGQEGTVFHKIFGHKRHTHFLWLFGEPVYYAWRLSPSRVVCKTSVIRRLTPRWSQRRLPIEFMDGMSYTTVIEIAEPLARRRGSALDR
jgi:hypothetical protein